MALPKTKNLIGPKKKKPGKKDKKNIVQSTGQYLGEVQSEFKKVIWPGRKEVVSASLVVFAAIVFFVAYIGILDVFFAKMVNTILPLIGG